MLIIYPFSNSSFYTKLQVLSEAANDCSYFPHLGDLESSVKTPTAASLMVIFGANTNKGVKIFF
jgi:hypothetical protein